MENNNANQPAFPVFLQEGFSINSHIDAGITKREYFAAMAMQGILANYYNHGGGDYFVSISLVATDAVSIADAVIDKLNNTP